MPPTNGNARAKDEAREKIAAQMVSTQPVLCTGTLKYFFGVLEVMHVGGDDGGEDREERHDEQKRYASHCQAILGKRPVALVGGLDV